jgi:predicted RNase H-like HicB family nuclease
MKKMTTNKLFDKYTYHVEWSEEDNAHIAHCLEFPSLMAHGDTSSKALFEIEDVVKQSIEWMKNVNEIIPEPFGLTGFKGNLMLRVTGSSIYGTPPATVSSENSPKQLEKNTNF